MRGVGPAQRYRTRPLKTSSPAPPDRLHGAARSTPRALQRFWPPPAPPHTPPCHPPLVLGARDAQRAPLLRLYLVVRRLHVSVGQPVDVGKLGGVVPAGVGGS